MDSKQKPIRAFASDNWAGVHPAVLAAIVAVNHGHVPSYGNDPYTHDAITPESPTQWAKMRKCFLSSAEPPPTCSVSTAW